MSGRDATLGLHHELLLLALRDRQGTTYTYGTYVHALGAAVLAELIEAGRLALAPDRKKVFVEPRNARPTGDAALDEALAKIGAARRRAQAAHWVLKVAGLKGLKDRVALDLCRRGILKAEEQTVLLIFHRRVYPEVNPRPERAVLERLRRAVFGETGAPDRRTLVLLSLADSVGLLPCLFDKARLKERKRQVKALVADEPLGRAVRGIIASQDAATTAAIVTTTAAT